MKRQTIKEIDKRIDEYFSRLVKITWGDAHGNHFIDNIQHITELIEIESVGWLIFMDKNLVTVASFNSVHYSIEEFEDIKMKFRYYTVIPRKTIWRVRLL